MNVILDAHLHSHLSRATSPKMNLSNISKYGSIKGLDIIGTGDFTHPKWLEELKNNLTYDEETELYNYEDMLFIPSVEVSTIYKQDKKTRKVHHVVLAPNFEVVDQLNEFFSKYSDLSIDGRPVLNKLTSPELVESVMDVSKDCLVIPAHIWTPYFGCLGSKTGFDSIEECYQDQTKNIHALETGLSCYDPDTEILTEEGWKKFTEVSKNEKICTLNKETEMIEYQHPQRIYFYNYKGKMYKVKTKRVDLLVTPNHKLAIRKYNGSPNFRKKPPIELIRADKRFGVQKVFKKDGTWRGKESKHFVLPEVKILHGNQYYSGNRKVKKKLLPIKSWLKFFGFWIAEGHTSPPNDGAYNVAVSNNNKNLLKEIKSALERMGFNPYLRKNNLRVRDYQLWKYLRQFGKAHEKWIPKKIRSLSSDLLRIFFDYYIKGDGHVYGRNNKGLSATTTSQKLRDDLQEVALKVGMSAYWKHTVKPGEQILPFGYKNKHDLWTIYFIRKNEHRVYPAGVEKYDHWKEEWVDYEGKVYCVSVPNSIIYVRRNGISVWCGNSDPSMNWQLSSLDKFTLLSFSDAHSPWPFRIGRESTIFNLKNINYDTLVTAIKKKDKDKLQKTIEFFPQEGKYHYDGHRKCGVRMSPKEAIKRKSMCPECRKELTIGVLHRVVNLGDRSEDFVPDDPVPYIHLIPLQEIIASVKGISTLYSKTVWNIFNKLINDFENEYSILLNVPQNELEKTVSKKLARAIIRVREENVKVSPGYDGVYGSIEIFKDDQEDSQENIHPQKSLLNF